MNKTFGLLFYLKKSKKHRDGSVPVYLRLTIDGVRVELSTKRYIIPEKWNAVAQKMTGNTEEVRSFNQFLKTIEQQVYNTYRQMMEKEIALTAVNIKNWLIGQGEPKRMLVDIFKNHNAEVRALLGKDYAPGTLERYETSLKHTIDFLKWKYDVADIEIKSINNEFISGYDFYLRSVRNCANNTAVKYMKNFKKVIRICIANGWLKQDPFSGYKGKVKEVAREFLTSDELDRLATKTFPTERLDQVRDIFLFSCLTGLAYIDVKKLKRSEIRNGIDGDKWVFTFRQKTESDSRIPILPLAWSIVEKYQDHPQCLADGTILPVPSNQKLNAYLKEIADVCGISKDLTFHMARHTFATTVTLSNGVPIESVSKMLGHKNIKITQHYAKILDRKVSDDMQLLKQKFTPK